MQYTVLAVDDDIYTRQMIRRVLDRDFQVRLLEAEHGAMALEVLLAERVDLMLLDISMPVMNGLETLQAIRKSDAFKALQIVILTGKAEEHQVMAMVGLGIAGFLLKPLRPGMFSERIAQLMNGGRRAESGTAPPPVRLSLHRRSRVLVADTAREFGEFCRRQLAPLCQVDVATSLAAALTLSVQSPPDVVALGVVEDMIELEVFARKVRAERAARPITFIGLSPQDAASPLYDAIAERSAVPETFRSALRPLLTPDTVARWVFAPGGWSLDRFGALVREHLATTLRGDVATERERPEWAFVNGRWVVVAVEVQGANLSWDMRLQVPYSAALVLTASLLAMEIDEVSEQRVRASLSDVAEALLTLLGTIAQQDGLTLKPRPPRVSAAAAYAAAEGRDRAGGAHWWYTFADASHGLALSVISLDVSHPGRRPA